MKSRKSFFSKNILLILIFAASNFTALGLSKTISDDGLFVVVTSDIDIIYSTEILVLVIFAVIASISLPSVRRFSFFYFKRVLGESINRTKKAPGSVLLKIADLFPKRYREDLKQTVSDMRLEYYEALSEKEIGRARFIRVFYYIGLGWSVVMWISDKAREVVAIIPKKN